MLSKISFSIHAYLTCLEFDLLIFFDFIKISNFQVGTRIRLKKLGSSNSFKIKPKKVNGGKLSIYLIFTQISAQYAYKRYAYKKECKTTTHKILIH